MALQHEWSIEFLENAIEEIEKYPLYGCDGIADDENQRYDHEIILPELGLILIEIALEQWIEVYIHDRAA